MIPTPTRRPCRHIAIGKPIDDGGPTGAHVQIGERTLHFRRRGSGPPLLLIQGMGGHHGLWGERFLGALAASFEVATFDHRGIGDSVDGTGADFTIADLAEDAVSLMDVLGWGSAHVLGVSMGGMVAQELVLANPDRVRALVLGCSYSGGAGSSLDATGPIRMLQAMGTGDVEAAIRVAYAVNLSPGFAADPTHFAAFLRAATAVEVPVAVVVRQARAVLAHDTSRRLSTVRAQTLVVHGTADQMLDPANGAMIAELIPGARLETLAEVGHLFWWERPEASAEMVTQHCRD